MATNYSKDKSREKYAKELGRKTKLYTNGLLISKVEELCKGNYLDAIAIDLKCIRDCKKILVRDTEDRLYLKSVNSFIKMVKKYKVSLEIRTTYGKFNIDQKDEIQGYVKRKYKGISHIFQEEITV